MILYGAGIRSKAIAVRRKDIAQVHVEKGATASAKGRGIVGKKCTLRQRQVGAEGDSSRVAQIWIYHEGAAVDRSAKR